MAGESGGRRPPSSLSRFDDPDLARWLDELRAQKRSRYTVKHYGITLRLFARWLREEFPRRARLGDVTESELKQYQIWLSTRKGYAKATLYISVKALQAFYRFLGSHVADDLRPPRRSQALPKYLSEAEATRLLSAAAGDARSHAILGLLLYGGLRVGELCAVRVPDLDFVERTVRIHAGKGDKDRLVIVSPKCMELVKAWLERRPATGGDHVFPGRAPGRPISPLTVQRMVVGRAKAAGLEKRVTPHVLRHTLATTLLRRGGDIRFIQRMLGHASIATTQVYTHLDDAELKRMYERAQPDF